MKDKNNTVEDFVFMNLREYSGVDLDGQIAVPRGEMQEKLKKVYHEYIAATVKGFWATGEATWFDGGGDR
jgi:hypothetical protein